MRCLSGRWNKFVPTPVTRRALDAGAGMKKRRALSGYVEHRVHVFVLNIPPALVSKPGPLVSSSGGLAVGGMYSRFSGPQCAIELSRCVNLRDTLENAAQVMEIVAEDLAPKKTYSDLVEVARDDQVGCLTGPFDTEWVLLLLLLLPLLLLLLLSLLSIPLALHYLFVTNSRPLRRLGTIGLLMLLMPYCYTIPPPCRYTRSIYYYCGARTVPLWSIPRVFRFPQLPHNVLPPSRFFGHACLLPIEGYDGGLAIIHGLHHH